MIASLRSPPFFLDDPRTAVITVRPQRTLTAAIGLHPDWRWQLYLEELPDRSSSVLPAHVSAVRAFWASTIARLGFALPIPVTQPTNDGAIQLVWDTGRHYIDVEVFSDRRIAWFYKNRDTGARGGTAEEPVPIEELPQDLLQRLRLLRG